MLIYYYVHYVHYNNIHHQLTRMFGWNVSITANGLMHDHKTQKHKPAIILPDKVNTLLQSPDEQVLVAVFDRNGDLFDVGHATFPNTDHNVSGATLFKVDVILVMPNGKPVMRLVRVPNAQLDYRELVTWVDLALTVQAGAPYQHKDADGFRCVEVHEVQYRVMTVFSTDKTRTIWFIVPHDN